MRSEDRSEPDRSDADPLRPDPEAYNVAPADMPPSPAGANADIGGEAAASRRFAGLPPELADDPEHQAGRPTPDSEPFLGFDGMSVDDVLDWIREADPEPPLLRGILAYESSHRHREPILRDCRQRIQRLGGSPPS